MRKRGCQSANHIDCDVDNELWQCTKCHRKFCYRDGAADDYLDYCDDCWGLAHLADRQDEKDKATMAESKKWYAFSFTAKDTANDFSTGTAGLIVAEGQGYLRLGDAENMLVGWISGDELDALVAKWLYLRSAPSRKSERARVDRIRELQDKQISKALQG